jgi:hypothetical protein
MRGKKVELSSLTTGRCFTLPKEEVEKEDKPLPKGASLRRTDSVMAPEHAWKVSADNDGQVECESASGEKKSFAADTKVVEIPREGWEKLKARGK